MTLFRMWIIEQPWEANDEELNLPAADWLIQNFVNPG